ncbi:MAG TPA: N-acetyl-gamma-glutamyl-phosphate reductase [Rhizomicrobium sp.]|nr:N-acetyl-gamma-glutamyl-phosphate reductase [Rhizomicrobium sp.]
MSQARHKGKRLKPLIYVDGAAGTTGLEIRERLAGRDDVAIRVLSDMDRKDIAVRTAALNEADIAVLCLPDEAAREAVALVENPSVRILDASSAHRTAAGWIYGFSELEPGRRREIAAAHRVSNPGCYATAFLALVRPLVRAGLIPADSPITATGLSGYSGGGRTMIEEFEHSNSPRFTSSVVRTYALNLAHKHVPEMRAHAGLVHPPVFAPTVGRFYRGMMVEVPLQLWSFPENRTARDAHTVLASEYAGSAQIEVAPFGEVPATIDAEMLKNTDRMALFVFGNATTRQARLIAVLDNLGKGAAGAAVQNLNIMLGVPDSTGLH